MKFEDLIKQARLNIGISQEHAGRIIHRSRSAIKGYETGVSTPAPAQLVALCRLYKVTPNEILGWAP